MERSDFVEMGEMGLVGCSEVDLTQVEVRCCCASGSIGLVWTTSSCPKEEFEARDEMEVGLAGISSAGGESRGGDDVVQSEPSIPTSDCFGLRGCNESPVLERVGT